MVALYWTLPTGESHQIVETEHLFHKTYSTAITGETTLLTAQHTAQMPTGLEQSGPDTYEATGLTIEWQSPEDTGCIAVTSYSIQGTDSSDDCCWSDLATGIVGLSGRVPDDGTAASGAVEALVHPGQPLSLRVIAWNDLGDGEPSDRITLVPAALPSAPAEIRTTTYGLDGSLALEWDIPSDTGGGDQSAVPAADIVYMLEVDEGFHEAASDQDNFTPLTSFDPEGIDLHTST